MVPHILSAIVFRALAPDRQKTLRLISNKNAREYLSRSKKSALAKTNPTRNTHTHQSSILSSKVIYQQPRQLASASETKPSVSSPQAPLPRKATIYCPAKISSNPVLTRFSPQSTFYSIRKYPKTEKLTASPSCSAHVLKTTTYHIFASSEIHEHLHTELNTLPPRPPLLQLESRPYLTATNQERLPQSPRGALAPLSRKPYSIPLPLRLPAREMARRGG